MSQHDDNIGNDMTEILGLKPGDFAYPSDLDDIDLSLFDEVAADENSQDVDGETEEETVVHVNEDNTAWNVVATAVIKHALNHKRWIFALRAVARGQ